MTMCVRKNKKNNNNKLSYMHQKEPPMKPVVRRPRTDAHGLDPQPNKPTKTTSLNTNPVNRTLPACMYKGIQRDQEKGKYEEGSQI